MQLVEDCAPGRRAASTLTVSRDDTARALGSGDVDVLATPRVAALCEAAAVKAVAPTLEEGKTTVGSWIEVDHRAPSRIGDSLTAEAVLLGVHGRRLEFSVTVNDGARDVARCRHRRVVVDRATFEA